MVPATGPRVRSVQPWPEGEAGSPRGPAAGGRVSCAVARRCSAFAIAPRGPSLAVASGSRAGSLLPLSPAVRIPDQSTGCLAFAPRASLSLPDRDVHNPKRVHAGNACLALLTSDSFSSPRFRRGWGCSEGQEALTGRLLTRRKPGPKGATQGGLGKMSPQFTLQTSSLSAGARRRSPPLRRPSPTPCTTPPGCACAGRRSGSSTGEGTPPFTGDTR